MSPPPRSRLSAGAEALAATLLQQPEGAHCDVLIVGSGYGGAVAAARLASATRQSDGEPVKVWLLERGQEHLSGWFPSSFGELPGQVRFSRQDGKPARGAPEGLFDIRIGTDVHVLLGNGLGGGSLINAGVMEEPRTDVFLEGWPTGLHSQLGALQAGFVRARAMIGAAPLPDPQPPKHHALQRLATAAGSAAVIPCAIAVASVDETTAAGVEMKACTQCGDCITGCNQGAKKTLDTSYLAWARRAGAELFCGGVVERIEKIDDGGGAPLWAVHWHFTSSDKRAPGAAPFIIRTRRLVLAAGSLGSTEILLRSQSPRLQFSKRLGEGFSTNGDQIAAVFRQNEPVHASRAEDEDPSQPLTPVGPTITGLVRPQHGDLHIAVEEFAVPAALRRVMGEVTTTFGLINGVFDGSWQRHAEEPDQDALAVTTAALEHTSIVGMMGDDGAKGRIVLAEAPAGLIAMPGDARVRIEWPPGFGDKTEIAKLYATQTAWLRAGAKGDGGTAVPSPSWSLLPAELAKALGPRQGTALTVHPLGGCAMADSAATGVVDAAGRVFDAAVDADATALHPGLAVLDGSIVPRALGINPALTIAALAEQAIDKLLPAWRLDPAAPAAAPGAALPLPETAPPPPWQPPRGVTAVVLGEQLHGELRIGGQRCWAQLEIPSIPIADLAALLPRKQRPIAFDGGQRAPRLRLYTLDDAADRLDDPTASRPFATLQLRGQLRLLEPDASAGNDAIAVMLDAMAVVVERVRSLIKPGGNPVASAWRIFRPHQHAEEDADEDPDNDSNCAVLEVLSLLATTRRTLCYAFSVVDGDGSGILKDAVLRGTKTLAFADRANPWRQLMEMQFELQRDPGAPVEPLGRLDADLDYFASKRLALIQITAQRDQPSALLDLAGLALLLLRLLLMTHWPHFIPPGDTAAAVAGRRPGALDGRTPLRYRVNSAGAMLSRYTPARIAAGTSPLLLIHGLSAAGSTFAHPSIPVNLVRFMLARGREVFVLDLRTSSANEPGASGQQRPGPFSFEETACGDIPAAVDKVWELGGHQPVDVVAHCIGSVMFCLAVLDHASLHTRIGRVVLSQVGPLSQMSPFNRLRGFLASFAQEFLEIDEFDVRPELDTQGRPRPERGTDGQSSVLIDAALASFPYPDDDLEAARAAALATAPGNPRDFRRVRHRADAIIGQTLQLDNVGDATLLALDAIYGWVKSRTLAQTLHTAREGVLTLAGGDNERVSGAALGSRFAFPVLLIHGLLNRVFDWRGSYDSYRLLCQIFGNARSVPRAVDGDIHLGAGTPQQLLLLQRYGHQDSLIGKHASFDVFPPVEAFLSEPLPARSTPVEAAPRLVCEQPWMGPMLGWMRAADDDPDETVVQLLVHAGARRAETLCVVLVPLQCDTAPDGRRSGWRGDARQARGFRLNCADAQRTQRELLLEQPLQLRWRDLPMQPGAAAIDHAVLLLHRQTQDVGTRDSDFADAVDAPPTASGLLGGFALADAATEAVQRFIDAGGSTLANTVLTLGPVQVAGRDLPDLPGLQRPLSFALASCQQPPALFDKRVAGDAYRRLAQLLERGTGPVPAFALLLGDQVYLDAMANVFETPAMDSQARARRAYELNWRLPPWRDVVARCPVYPMADDHEVADNWQPPASDAALLPAEQSALTAWWRHQGKLTPPGPAGSHSYCFAPGGVPIFMLDTRRRRQRRAIVPSDGVAAVEDAAIAAPADWAALQAWLLAQRDAPVKFVATPSVVFPFEHGVASVAERLRYDSWSGYPASLHALLSFIDAEAIDGVVFLSGDAHLSMCAEFAFDSARATRLHAVVSSGMYTPWPFANTRREDLHADGAVALDCGHGRWLRGTLSSCASSASGFAIVEVQPGVASTTVNVSLPGRVRQHWTLPPPSRRTR